MTLCIAHGGDVSSPSGGSDRVTALAGGLADRDVDVALVVPEPAGDLPARVDDVDVVPVDTSVAGASNAITRAWSVTRTAAREASRRDATLQFEHSTLAGIATLHTDRPFVLDMHDLAYGRYEHVDSVATPLLRRGVSWVERRAVAQAQHVVSVSEYMRDVLGERWGVEPRCVDVVPNGYFADRVEPYIDTPVVEGRVCFLGTLHPKVDVGAFAALADLDAVSEVVVVGDGAQRDAVERLAAEHEAVRATGRLPDEAAFELVASAAVLVNPQDRSAIQSSSSPVKLYYYAAFGRPMVVSGGPEVAATLASRDAAIVSEGRDEFVAGVASLLGDPDRAEAYATNAASAAEAFEWSRRVDEFASVYDGLVSARTPGDGGA